MMVYLHTLLLKIIYAMPLNFEKKQFQKKSDFHSLGANLNLFEIKYDLTPDFSK